MIQLRRVVFEKQEREKVYVYKLLEKKKMTAKIRLIPSKQCQKHPVNENLY